VQGSSSSARKVGCEDAFLRYSSGLQFDMRGDAERTSATSGMVSAGEMKCGSFDDATQQLCVFLAVKGFVMNLLSRAKSRASRKPVIENVLGRGIAVCKRSPPTTDAHNFSVTFQNITFNDPNQQSFTIQFYFHCVNPAKIYVDEACLEKK